MSNYGRVKSGYRDDLQIWINSNSTSYLKGLLRRAAAYIFPCVCYFNWNSVLSLRKDVLRSGTQHQLTTMTLAIPRHVTSYYHCLRTGQAVFILSTSFPFIRPTLCKAVHKDLTSFLICCTLKSD